MNARFHRPKRAGVTLTIVIAAALSLSACSAASAVSGAAGGGAQGQAQGQGQRTPFVTGEITKVAGSTISLQGANAASSVTVSSSTKLSQDISASASDLVTGSCVVARTTPSASGSASTSASTVALSTASSTGSCTASVGGAGGGRFGPGSGGGAGGGGFTPPVSGVITGVSGSTVTVKPSANATSSTPTAFTFDANTVFTRSESASTTDLATGKCVVATGTASSSNTLAASTIVLSAKGASGCVSTFGGRFAGGGGGGGAGGSGSGGNN
ncbi:MAG TPA: DUF5666 domain-containing protein [Microbacteriaceae bacterium]